MAPRGARRKVTPAPSFPRRHVPADCEAGSDPSSAGRPARASLSASGQYWVGAGRAGRGEKTQRMRSIQ